MDRFRSWINLERLRALVEETAWRPSEPLVRAPPSPPGWGDDLDARWGTRRRPRFFAPDEYFEHDVPPSRRRTETPTEPPRSEPDSGRFEPRRRRRWTGVIDDGVPMRDGWAELEAYDDPRGRGGQRVEPPPQPRVVPPPSRLDAAIEPRLERRAARPNRSVEPPPEPRIPVRSSVPPPPSFGPRVLYEPPRVRSLEDRLAHLLDWATDVSGSDVAFVADHEGLLLARRHASDVEEAVAAVLEGFLEQLGPFLGDAVEGHVTLRSHGRVFVVTWHETEVGRFFLGIVGAVPPPPSVVPELASALASTVVDVGELARLDVALPRSPTPAPTDPTPPPLSRRATPPPIDPPSPPRRATPPPLDPLPPPRRATPPPIDPPSSPRRATPPPLDPSPPDPDPSPPRVPRRVTPPPMPAATAPPPAPVHAGVAVPMGMPAPLAETADDSDAIRFDAPPAPAPEPASPEPTPPPEVAPTRARMLADAMQAAFDPRVVRLRVSLQTGIAVDALSALDALGEAELDAVSTALQRIVGLDPARIRPA